jgi:hypothetical protein
MATLARRLRQRLGVTSMLVLSGLVMTLCGSGCGIPILFSFPPQVQFISNGQYKGTYQIEPSNGQDGVVVPITGTLAFLSGETDYIKLSISSDTGEQQGTSDVWVVVTPTVVEQWTVSSTDPTTCQKTVWSGNGKPPTTLEEASIFEYPQCTAWKRTPRGEYSLSCTVKSADGNAGSFDILAILSTDNKLVQLQQSSDSFGAKSSLIITMTSQGTTPPVPSDFDRPSICN